jgi:tetratricopeptide (TPR) repeat protein
MISQDQSAKITDFGLANVPTGSVIEPSQIPLRDHHGQVGFSAMSGIILGTPTHMSPEQFIDTRSCDERSDIYSFGVVLYQMASGKFPFLALLPKNHSEAEWIRFWSTMHRLHAEATVPRLMSPLFPLIQRCLEKEQADRYQSFWELRGELESLLHKLTGEVIEIPKFKELEVSEWDAQGVSLTTLGRLEEAIQCFDTALLLDPRHHNAWINKGNALVRLGRRKEAIACYDKSLEICPEAAVAWHNKGMTLFTLGRFEKAIQCYDKAIETRPRYAEAWHGKGNALGGLGRHQEAIDCCDRALEINATLAGAWCSKGVSLNYLGRHSEAIECYDRALEINPALAEAWSNKGFSLGALGRLLETIACCDKALEINPKHTDAWYNKGEALMNLGRHQEAMACFDRARNQSKAS